MQTNLSNQSGIILLKTHVSTITKHALKLAERKSTVHAQEVALNKSTTATYNFSIVDNALVDIVVTAVVKA